MPHTRPSTHAARSPRHQRATVLVEVAGDGTQGLLVCADTDGFWWLPGGRWDPNAPGPREPFLATAVRALSTTTGMTAHGGVFFMEHRGNHHVHHVFVLQATGTPTMTDDREIPALGLCLPDRRIIPLAAAASVNPARFRLTSSCRQIISTYDQHKAEQPERLVLPTFALPDDPLPRDAAYQPPAAPVQSPRTGGNRAVQVRIGTALLELGDGDIVRQDLDAVVNAANEGLHNGSGVCGAIHAAAGARELAAACRQLGGCPVGAARLTPGFKLRARFIIHAVGPRYANQHRTASAHLLASAYTSSLRLARTHGIRSIAFPSLSTGVFGYPIADAAPIALRTVMDYMQRHPEIRHVRFVLRQESFAAYQHALQHLDVPGTIQ